MIAELNLAQMIQGCQHHILRAQEPVFRTLQGAGQIYDPYLRKMACGG